MKSPRIILNQALMKARKNPTTEQLARRIWREYPDEASGLPVECLPKRALNDAYWALRCQGYPHSYAKRAFRDKLPVVRERTSSPDFGDYEPEELLVPVGAALTDIEVEVRSHLSEDSIREFIPRGKDDYLWDIEVPGFAARIRKTGYKCFVVFYRVRHTKRLRKFTIGNIAEFSLEQARSVAREIRREARMGRDPATSMQNQSEQG